MTTTDTEPDATSNPWRDENDTPIAEGDWVVFRDRERTIIERVVEVALADGPVPFLLLANDDDVSPSDVARVEPYPAEADEPDWYHDPIGNRWVGPVGDGTIVVEIFGDAGRHARTAVGVAELPRGVAVEVDDVVAVDHE